MSVVEPGTDLPVPAGTPGEIVVDMKMPNIVMRTYAGMPEKTAEDFRNLKLHTGDLGRLDEDGYLYFLDRVKDYIRRRGENVSSMEVEHVVTSHAEILECAAIGVKAQEGASAEDEILVFANMPGVTAEDVDVRFENGELAVHGRRAASHPDKPRTTREFEVTSYFRSFRVTEQIAADKIAAELKHGVLTLHLPKVEAVKPRRIAVKG